MPNFNGWIAYLDNGDTIPQSEPIPGEKTPWQKLLERCRNENIEMKRLSLVFNGVQIMSMNRKQCDGFFQAKEVRKEFFGSMGENGKQEVLFQGIGSVKDGLVFITWFTINPKAPHVTAYISTDVRPLNSCIIHTTLS